MDETHAQPPVDQQPSTIYVNSPKWGLLSRVYSDKRIITLRTLVQEIMCTQEIRLSELEELLASTEVSMTHILDPVVVVLLRPPPQMNITPGSSSLLSCLESYLDRPSSRYRARSNGLTTLSGSFLDDVNQALRKDHVFSKEEFGYESWNRLYGYLGKHFFYYLASMCSVFRVMPNRNYIQVLGQSVTTLRPDYVPSLIRKDSALSGHLNQMYLSNLEHSRDRETRLELWKAQRQQNNSKRPRPSSSESIEDSNPPPSKKPRLSAWRRKQAKINAESKEDSPSELIQTSFGPIESLPSVKDHFPIKIRKTSSSTSHQRISSIPLNGNIFRPISRSHLFYARPSTVSFGLPVDWKGKMMPGNLIGARMMAAWIFEMPENSLPKRALQSLPMLERLISAVQTNQWYLWLQFMCPIPHQAPPVTSAAQEKSIQSVPCAYPSTAPPDANPPHSSTITGLRIGFTPITQSTITKTPTHFHHLPSASRPQLDGENRLRSVSNFLSQDIAMASSGVKQRANSNCLGCPRNNPESDLPLTQETHDVNQRTIENSPVNPLDIEADALLVELIEQSPDGASTVAVDKLLSCFNTHSQVTSFITKVMREILPRELLGSFENWRLFELKIANFVSLMKNDQLSSKCLIEGMKISHVSWLHKDFNVSQNRKSTPQDLKLQTDLFHSFLYWIFEHFIIPLLRTNFYITDTANNRNEVFYFRREVWTRINDVSFEGLLQRSIMRPISNIEAERILASRELGISFMRFLPKKNGVRPIVNLKRKFCNPEKADSNKSINMLLRPVQEVISHETVNHSEELLASSLLRNDQVHQRLRNFKIQLQAQHQPKPGPSQKEQSSTMDVDELAYPNIAVAPLCVAVPTTSDPAAVESALVALPRLYFVKVDIMSAYDEINQGLLLKIIEKDVFSLEEYLSVLWTRTRVEQDMTKVITTKSLRSSKMQQRFSDLVQEQARKTKNSIFVDESHPERVDRASLLSLLRQHITQHIIKHKQAYYVQFRGIPQGSCVSALLCSIYFAHLEKTKLSHLTKDALMMRWIDDFLYITTNKEQAIEFFNLMHNGFGDYGSRCNPDKSQVNFDLTYRDKSISNVSSQLYTQHVSTMVKPDVVLDEIVWCGWSINTKTLEVRRTVAPDLKVSTMVSNVLSNHPGEILQHRIILSMRMRVHPILFDSALNSRAALCENISDVFIWCSMRLVCLEQGCHFVNSDKPRVSLQNEDFIMDTLFILIDAFESTILRKAEIKGNVLTEESPSYTTSIKWGLSWTIPAHIALCAASRVFRLKTPLYTSLATKLQAFISKNESRLSSPDVEMCRAAIDARMAKFSRARF